jgi:KaiC/GvpD/RAD55 family RecA-like ATPase
MINEKVATGILTIDYLLGGGIPKNQITIIEGSSGIGKTIMGLQFLKEGLYTDERVLLITAKDSPEQIKNSITSLEWDIDWAFNQEKFLILDIRGYFEDIDKNLSQTINSLLKEIIEIINQNKIKRVVVDPMYPFFLDNNDNDKKQFVYYLSKMIEKSENECTIIFIRTINLVEENIEANIIKMYFDNEKFQRIIFLQKVLFAQYQLKEYSFSIEKGKGIVLNG